MNCKVSKFTNKLLHTKILINLMVNVPRGGKCQMHLKIGKNFLLLYLFSLSSSQKQKVTFPNKKKRKIKKTTEGKVHSHNRMSSVCFVCVCTVIQKTLSNINHLKDVYYIKTHYYVR